MCFRAHRVEELEFPGEYHSVGELGVALTVLHVLEPLEVEGQDLGELLDPESLGGLLLAATLFTVVLVFSGQCLGGRKLPGGGGATLTDIRTDMLLT